eukprot:g79036.t1
MLQQERVGTSDTSSRKSSENDNQKQVDEVFVKTKGKIKKHWEIYDLHYQPNATGCSKHANDRYETGNCTRKFRCRNDHCAGLANLHRNQNFHVCCPIWHVLLHMEKKRTSLNQGKTKQKIKDP